jgi:hypothetical protein
MRSSPLAAATILMLAGCGAESTAPPARAPAAESADHFAIEPAGPHAKPAPAGRFRPCG